MRSRKRSSCAISIRYRIISCSRVAVRRETIKLIDWEYSGTQDPHLDIAMFIVYAMYMTAREADRLIDLYFTEGCDEAVRLKIYCYIAVSGLL